MSAVDYQDDDDGGGFLLTPLRSSSSSMIDLISEDFGLFGPVTTDRSSADDDNSTFAGGFDDGLDACSANTYVYEDFTQTEWVRAGFIVLYVAIVVLSVVGNFMVIWTVARNRHMRTVTNYYILNLAVADFLVALAVVAMSSWVVDVFLVALVVMAMSSWVVDVFLVALVVMAMSSWVVDVFLVALAVVAMSSWVVDVFLVALVVMPLKLVEYTAPCQWHVFSRHSALCPLLYYVLPVFVFTSILTLAAISVERSVTYLCRS